MPSDEWHNERGQSSSQSNSCLNESHKEGVNVTHTNRDKGPRWRRILASRKFWIVTTITMLLLGLVLGLSIGLTVSKTPSLLPNNEPGSPQPTGSNQPAQLLGPVVDLGYTKYQGDSYPNGISQWLGIRYAQPPLGDLRFAAPQNVTANNTLQMATRVCPSFPLCLLLFAKDVYSAVILA